MTSLAGEACATVEHASATATTQVRIAASYNASWRCRRGKPIVLIVHAAEMAAAGHVFYRSENGVWLVDRVPPEYLA
jgi:putative RNA 2'-phosphotransferase